jgi:hypothetical protein
VLPFVSRDDGWPAAHRHAVRTDAEHLKLLSIFHLIGAGLAFIGILFLLGHHAIFSTFINNPKMWQRQGPPPVEFFLQRSNGSTSCSRSGSSAQPC